ncbi:hypothetical protein CCACVL1_09441 [Corchorus capsularis]|uniref:Uncharacterized protein n=1 Tax=Corchorus capsularis TaxID=210143 RepID=A0A1R3IW83_COCAP|nr:hypothetical protein CCACVL1_09441 [Corchorus capsularis]
MHPQLNPPPVFVGEKSFSTQRDSLTKFSGGNSTITQVNPAKGLLVTRKVIPMQTESSKASCGGKRKSSLLRQNSELVIDHDSDSTQSPYESDDVYESEDDHDMIAPSELTAHRRKKARGKYSEMRLDLKTQGVKVKLNSCLASDRLRPVDAENSEETYKSSREEMLNAIKITSFNHFEMKFDPETGLLPRADNIWFLEHSRGKNDGNVEWSDNLSKEIGDKMTSLIGDPSQEVPETLDEIYLVAMEGRSGYYKGFGYNKQGLIEGT